MRLRTMSSAEPMPARRRSLESWQGSIQAAGCSSSVRSASGGLDSRTMARDSGSDLRATTRCDALS